jgi:hypothetical protein
MACTNKTSRSKHIQKKKPKIIVKKTVVKKPIQKKKMTKKTIQKK